MALICSCGAELPDNARFCHQCGKPQREEDMRAAEVSAPAAVFATTPDSGIAINFGNGTAVRVALACGSVCALLNSIPVVVFGCCLWWLAAGFVAAFLYSRRMATALTVGEGGRLGAITGVFTFVIWVLFASLGLLLPREGPSLRDLFRQSMEKMPAQDEATRRMVEMMASPAGLAAMVIVALVVGFVVTVSLVSAGGALGAKVMEKD